MSELADELDEGLLAVLCEELREHCHGSDLDVACCAVDILRALNESGYTLLRLTAKDRAAVRWLYSRQNGKEGQ